MKIVLQSERGTTCAVDVDSHAVPRPGDWLTTPGGEAGVVTRIEHRFYGFGDRAQPTVHYAPRGLTAAEAFQPAKTFRSAGNYQPAEPFLPNEVAAVSEALPAPWPPRSIVRHNKTSNLYEIVGHANVQTSTWFDGMRSVDMDLVVAYRSLKDGSLWVRPHVEFYDGRFTFVRKPGQVA